MSYLCEVCRLERVCQIGFAETDRFCGYCGYRLREIRSRCIPSPATDVDSSRAWLYPTRLDGQWRYVLPITMSCGNHHGRIETFTQVAVDSAVSSLLPDYDTRMTSNTRLASAKELQQSQGKRLERVQFAEEGTLCVLPVTVDGKLPKEGLRARVQLEGSFGKEAVSVLICNSPMFRISAEGDCLSASEWNAKEHRIHVRVWKKGQVELTLKLATLNAPVLCTNAVRVDQETPDIRLQANEWRQLTPESPQLLRFTIRTTDWNPQEPRDIELILPLHGVSSDDGKPAGFSFRVRFEWVDEGDLEITPSQMHAGRLSSGQTWREEFAIRNIGARALGHLDIEAEPAWIQLTAESRHFSSIPGGDTKTLRVAVDADAVRRGGGQFPVGEIRLRELVGARRVWRIPVSIDRLVDPEPLNAVLAIDLGSMNTCAAYYDPEKNGRAALRPFPLNPMPESPETAAIIPSAIIFHDVSDEKRPVVKSKFEAEAVADSVRRGVATSSTERLMGIVEDAKRWIGTGRHMFTVFDQQGRRARFAPETILRLQLRQVINRARQVRSIQRVEISFPTTFSKRQQRAYVDILQQLQDEYRDLGLTIDFGDFRGSGPLRLDEASAAAICFLYGEEKLTESRARFGLAAVDWGGGTFDVCVMELEATSVSQSNRYRTTYRGFGGDSRLGGNDVTATTVAVLRRVLLDGIRKMLEPLLPENQRASLKQLDIPLAWHHQAGASSSSESLGNYHQLHLIAEDLKIILSNRAATKSHGIDAPSELAALPRDLRDLLGGIVVRIPGDTPKRLDELCLMLGQTDRNVMKVLEEAIQFITLEQIYDEPMVHQESRDTVRERLERCVLQLRRQVELAETPLAYVLLAGAASRLPLLEQLLRKAFGNEVQIVFRPQMAKARVSYGLAIYSKVADVGNFFEDFARPSDVVPDPLGFALVCGDAELQFIKIIPAGTHWQPGDVSSEASWFSASPEQVTIRPHSILGVDGRQERFRVACALYAGSTQRLVGVFDLEQERSADGKGGIKPVPKQFALSPLDRIWLRVCGHEQIQMKISSGVREFGWFDLKWDAEAHKDH